ncbi:uncharacterized protein [Cherax quadricarinatus]
MAGDLENTELVMLTPGDFEEVSQLMEHHFLKRNPLCIAAKETTPACYGESLDVIMKLTLDSGLSVGAREKKTKKLVAILLATKRVDRLRKNDSHKLRKQQCVVHSVLAMINVDAAKLESITSYLCLEFVCVHPDYTGRGLARTMIQKVLNMDRECGVEAVCVQVANASVDRICSRLGFETVKSLDLKTIADEFGLDLSLIPQEETIIKLMIKRWTD